MIIHKVILPIFGGMFCGVSMVEESIWMLIPGIIFLIFYAYCEILSIWADDYSRPIREFVGWLRFQKETEQIPTWSDPKHGEILVGRFMKERNDDS